MKYATALNKPGLSANDQDKKFGLYALGGNTVLCHDIHNGYNDQFNKCDILYSEPAWRHGYDIFMSKAGYEKRSFEQYVTDICSFVKLSKKPAIIITGVKDSKLYQNNLKFEDSKIKLKVHNCNAMALFYNIPAILVNDNIELLNIISKKFNNVGDFCAGYGNTADVFHKAGKNFVMSDVNPYYVSHMVNKYENI
mgnify:CR=1 FL=1